MNIGLRLTLGFGMLLAVLGGVLAFGWHADSQLSRHYGVLEESASVETELKALHADTLAMMLHSSFADHTVLVQKSASFDRHLERLQSMAEHPDEVARMKQVLPANRQFRKALTEWANGSLAVASVVDDCQNALVAFLDVLTSLGGKGRDSIFVHADGYASLDLVRARFSELRLVNDIERNVRLSREALEVWQRTDESGQLVLAQEKFALALTFAQQLHDDMARKNDRSIVLGMIDSGKKYIEAVSALQKIASSRTEQRVALIRAMKAMQIPLQRLSERHRVEVSGIRESGLIVGLCATGFALLWVLLMATSFSAALRKRLDVVRDALLSLNEGDSAVRLPEDSSEDVYGVVETLRRLVQSENALAETAQTVARGVIHINVPVRSSRDLLGGALGQIVQANKTFVELLALLAQGDLRFQAVPRSSDDAPMRALTDVSAYWIKVWQDVSDSSKKDIVGFEKLEKYSAALQKLLATAPKSLHAPEHMEDTASAISESLQEITERASVAVGQATNVRREMVRMETAMREMAARATFAEEVARQVDTLSMNISIEAARFGDDGRGLSGVVHELRGVVERCRITSQSLTEHAEAGMQAMISSGRAIEDLVVNTDSLADAKSLVDPVVVRCSEIVRTAIMTENQLLPQLQDIGRAAHLLDTEIKTVQRNAVASTLNGAQVQLPKEGGDFNATGDKSKGSSDGHPQMPELQLG